MTQSTLKSIQIDVAHTPANKQWKRIGIHHHHGICVPLPAIHTALSGGVGEYLDLLPLIDWCHQTKMDVLQLLPLNDTGNQASPYSAISAFALNPLHLSCKQLPRFSDYPALEKLYRKLQALMRSKRVAYDKVRTIKEQLLQQYFAWEYPRFATTDSYQDFVSKNSWLKPYSVYKILSTQHEGLPWQQWPAQLRSPDEKVLCAIAQQYYNTYQYHHFIQYLCFQQMEKVRLHAEKQKVFLKGDIPILINMDSADVWWDRRLFTTKLIAGAPPDHYTPKGQKWGFPLFDWSAMEQDNHRWWKERLRVASKLYHIYRIDHILGFFRIWAIPKSKSAKAGFFLPKDSSLWISQGTKLLNVLLESSRMLPIGEDLGFVPEGVRPCLRKLGICGTRVQRWERRWDTDESFIPPEHYNPLSLATVSTHDSETLAQWWRYHPQDAQRYAESKGWNYSSDITTAQRKAILHEAHHAGSLFHINLLQEYLALDPNLVHHKPEDERINIPGTRSVKNWSYRFVPSIEELQAHPSLSSHLREILD